MPAPEIEISKDGLKLSYQRYLADSTAGFVVILAVLFVVSKGYPLPFLGHSLESFMKLSDNVQLFVFLLLFLLATPIGLFINGLSWFLLGWCKVYLITPWFKLGDEWYNPLLPTKKAFGYSKHLIGFFGIDSNTCLISEQGIYEISEQYQDYLSIFSSEKIRLEHVTGLSQFTRNFALLSCISCFTSLHLTCWYAEITIIDTHCFIVISLALSACSIFLYSLIESFRCLKILSTIYLICIARGISKEDGATPQELIRKIHAAYVGDNSGTASSSNP